jgi:hypothetical protein
METPVNDPGAFPLPEWEKSLEAIGVLGGTSKVCGEERRGVHRSSNDRVN